MEMSSLEVIKRLVALGFGVSIVPEVAVRGEVARKELVAIPLTGLGARQVGVALPSPGPASRAARAFVALLEQRLAA
jgi:DNA-binding transcriptional LysR family regulator